MIAGVMQLKRKTFEQGNPMKTNMTLHIKDPRDKVTYCWVHLNENLFTIRVLPADASTEYICKVGKGIQKITAIDKVLTVTKVLAALAEGWVDLIPGLDDLLHLIPGPLLNLYQLKDLLSSDFNTFVFGVEGSPLAIAEQWYDNTKEVYETAKGGQNDVEDNFKNLDYSQEVFTSKDKADLSRLLEYIWIEYLSELQKHTCEHEPK